MDSCKSPLRRSLIPSVLLIVVWHSLDSSNPASWNISELQRDLKALVTSYSPGTLHDKINQDNPVRCQNVTHCCGIWNVSADRWWLHHPHYEIISEEDDFFCFSRIQDVEKRRFMEEIHYIQWQLNVTEQRDLDSIQSQLTEDHNFTVNCSDMRASVHINSGYGASIGFLLQSFYEAYLQRKPFQTIEKEWAWLYAVSNEHSPWINCTVQDQSCLYLPISPCSREDKGLPKLSAYPNKTNTSQVMHWLWIEEYLTRPKQPLRKEIQKRKQPLKKQLENGCIAIHVRRGDVAAPQPPYRRYAAVQEYLDKIPNLKDNATIFLMSDDASTIDEVQRYHAPKYQWVYANKTRVQGVRTGFNQHVPTSSSNGSPSSSGPDELAWIIVEQDLAARYCNTLVHGNSGYAHTLMEKIKLRGNNVTTHYLETLLTDASEIEEFRGKPLEREAYLMQKVKAKYVDSN